MLKDGNGHETYIYRQFSELTQSEDIRIQKKCFMVTPLRWITGFITCGLLSISFLPAQAVVGADLGFAERSLRSMQTERRLLAQLSSNTDRLKQASACPEAVLSRLTRHQVASGETLESIATQYEVLPATLIGLNPSLLQGSIAPGREILIPPYNGIRVEVPAGTTWQDLADRYNVRADVLFEVNGCQATPQQVVFIPGVNWSPEPIERSPRSLGGSVSGYPLPEVATVSRQYGWQSEPGSTQIEFHSGVDLLADIGTPVLSVGDGTVAFVGEQGDYGKLVVINHQQGLQTRYAQLSSVRVTVGQTVRSGQSIAASGESGQVYAPHLHFEIRSNSNLGWVAQDPARYLEHMRMFDR